MVSTLRELGINKKTVMLTGDSQRAAEAIAEELGVDDFRAEVLPNDKAQYISDLRAEAPEKSQEKPEKSSGFLVENGL